MLLGSTQILALMALHEARIDRKKVAPNDKIVHCLVRSDGTALVIHGYDVSAQFFADWGQINELKAQRYIEEDTQGYHLTEDGRKAGRDLSDPLL